VTTPTLPPRCSEHVLEPLDEDASFDFEPSERPWRDVMCVRRCALRAPRSLPARALTCVARSHEVAAALGLYTETNGEEGERFVTVRKARPRAMHAVASFC